jgi:peptidoglycan/LPS O-acetylase OafA/YrhL/lysophospholipase L1-like esterase
MGRQPHKSMYKSMNDQRIVSLDGLRGLAALGVALPHFLILREWSPDVSEPVAIVAVEIFFVLSGFVLAPQILHCLSERTHARLPVFFLRRWMRTLPPYALALSVIGVLTGHFLDASFFQHLFFIQNVFSIDDKNDFFSPAWSLAVEEWFYVLFPLYLVAMKRSGCTVEKAALLFGLIFLVAKIACYVFDAAWLTMARRLVAFRLDSICFGFLLFLVASPMHGRRPRLFAFASLLTFLVSTIALIAIFANLRDGSRGLLQLIFMYVASAFGASLIALALQCESAIRSSAPARWVATWLGRLSYDVYLFHLPLIMAVAALGWEGPAALLTYVSLLLIVCTGVYVTFERPILAARPHYLSAREEALLPEETAERKQARRTLIAAIAIIGLTIGGMAVAGERLVNDPFLFNLYYFADAFFLASGAVLMLSAFLHSKAKLVGTSRGAMIASGALFSLVLTDQYILNFRYDTTGPGGPLVTHANWRRTFVHNNSLGFWERDIRPGDLTSDTSLTIAATGTSFTWGQGVKGAQYRFTRVLEDSFRANGVRASVLNFTLGGTIAAMNQFHPDVVLLCFTMADIDPLNFLDWSRFKPTYDSQSVSVINPTANFLVWKRIAPLQYSFFGLALLTNKILAYGDDAAFKTLMESIRSKAEEVRGIGATPVYVLLPFPHIWALFQPAVRETTHEKFLRALGAIHLPVVDLSPIDKEFTVRQFEVNTMDAHPNEQMHELMGRRLYQQLVPLLQEIGIKGTTKGPHK